MHLPNSVVVRPRAALAAEIDLAVGSMALLYHRTCFFGRPPYNRDMKYKSTTRFLTGSLLASTCGVVLGVAAALAGGAPDVIAAFALPTGLLFLLGWGPISRVCAMIFGPAISGPGPARLMEWERSRAAVCRRARRWVSSAQIHGPLARARRWFAAVRPRSTRRMFRARAPRRARAATGSSSDGDPGGADPPARPNLTSPHPHPAPWPPRPGNGDFLFSLCSESYPHV